MSSNLVLTQNECSVIILLAQMNELFGILDKLVGGGCTSRRVTHDGKKTC